MLQPGAHVAANCRVDEVDRHVAERPEHAVDPARSPACNMQHAACSEQHMHRAACNRAACSIRPTPSTVHGATCSARNGPCAAAACSCVHSLSYAHAHTRARARAHTRHGTAPHACQLIHLAAAVPDLPTTVCTSSTTTWCASDDVSPSSSCVAICARCNKMTKPTCNVPRCNIQ
jgi:hypothetical protein